MSASLDDPVRLARQALDRHAWQEAYEALAEADRQHGLSADGLRMLADAAWWTGHPDTVFDAAERAYSGYVKEGDRRAAAMMAFELARQNAMRMAMPVASGWMGRAERLAADDPDSPVLGWLAWMRGLIATMQPDYDGALRLYDEALAIAGRIGDRDLQAMSLHDKGYILCSRGSIREGLALMDDVMGAAVGGDLAPWAAGYVYCGMIAMCSHLGDYRRAAEWTEATTRWCERHSITGFPGICRVHRAELMRVRGAWPSAEEEARVACEELPRFNFLTGLGYAFYEIGEVRRRMGDLTAAEDAFGRAHEFGKSPQPGLALLRLAQGKVDAAAAAIRQTLAEATEDRLARLRPLAAQVEIALAAGDVDTAAAAVEELESIVGGYEATALHAMAACARGAVQLARGDAEGALAPLRRARDGWQEVEAPYEVAEARVLLGRVYRAMGNDEAAAMELRTARTAYERLGARPAAAAAGELLAEITSATEALERVSRAFVFTDIVKSTDLVTAIGDEAWEDLLRWHDQTLRSLFAAHGGEVVQHTGDGFFVAFDAARSALASAVAVQRALAEHRRAHGFAPVVRIGVHAAEATRRGQDYSGAEVHKAARIAAAAEGGEILASDRTLAQANGGFTVSRPRAVEAKGIPQPVRVATVEWRAP